MSQELLNALRAQLPGMLPLMKLHIAPDPLQVRLLRAIRQLPCAYLLPRHLQQTRTTTHAAYHTLDFGQLTPPARQWKQGVEAEARRLTGGNDGIHPGVSAFYL